MKKIITACLCLLAVYATAQTGLTTSSSVTLNTGIVKTSMYVECKVRLQGVKSTGAIVYDLFFYNSYSDMIAGKGRLYPKVGGVTIYSITVAVSDSDVIKASGVTTINDVTAFHYQKVKSGLLAQYSITCI